MSKTLLTVVLAASATAVFAAPGDILRAPAGMRLAGRYIVVLQDDAAPGAPGRAGLTVSQVGVDFAARYGGSVMHFYEHALRGFSIRASESAARALALDPRVKYVEEDSLVQAVGTQTAPPSFGLDRIDQRDLPLDNSYTFDVTGQGVHAYIIDTGIRATHQDFGGRVGAGFDAVGDGNGTNDCNGHGTHVSGTVGGASFGVAKGVTLHPIRVLDCNGSGTTSGVIAGVDFVTSNHAAMAVANMSLGGGASQALDDAVNRSISSGVTYAIAAGNSNADACGSSPARVPAALTVGSTTSTDARSSFSNFGTCVDVFAPGSNITSAWKDSDTATNTISGTSMATPHVTGVAALVVQANPGFTPAQVAQAIVNNATTGRITSVGTGSPNRLLFSRFNQPSPPPPPPGGTELVQNGGFEGASASPWTLTGNALRSTGGFPHSGTGYLLLGRANSSSGSAFQQVAIPAGTAPKLSFWVNIDSAETTTTTVFDRFFVEVTNTSGTVLRTLLTASNLNKMTAGSYVQVTGVDLSAFAGQTIRVQFRATTDSSLVTNFRVDDVSVK